MYALAEYTLRVHYAHRYGDWVERPDDVDRLDIAKALLAAAKANHVKIVEIILRKDSNVFQHGSVLKVLDESSGFCMWQVAVLEGHPCIFEVRL